MASSMLETKARLLEKYPASQLETMPPTEINKLRSSFPGIPEDYLQYLEGVGHGNIGEWNFKVYSGPIDASEIYDPTTAESLAGIVLVGDNFSGEVVGYNTRNQWQIGEIDSSSEFQPLYGGITTFTDMIQDRFLADA